MATTITNGNHSETIDLPIIDISEVNYATGKKILDAFVSAPRNGTAS
jgi:hypothetical protein